MEQLLTSRQYCDLAGADPNARFVLAKQHPGTQMTLPAWNQAAQPLGLHVAPPDAPAADAATSDPPTSPAPAAPGHEKPSKR